MIINSIVLIFFIISFLVIAEMIYLFSEKEYQKSKSKYLRELIYQKNSLFSPDQSFSSCVYENWDSNGMELSEAYKSCEIISQIQSN